MPFSLRLIICCSSFLTWFALPQSKAQEPYYYHYTDENGLSSNEIFHLFQDRNSNILVATDGGLFRYNGTDFKYLPTPTACGRSVTSIQQDGRGRVWCHDFKGHLLYVNSDSLQDFTYWNQYHSSSFASFAIDKQNNIWVKSNTNTIYCIDPYRQKTLRTLQLTDNAFELFLSKQGDLLTNLALQGIYSYNINTDTAQRITKNIPNTTNHSYEPFRFIAIGAAPATLALSFTKPLIYTLEDRSFNKHPISTYLAHDRAVPICAYFDEAQQTLWLGTYIGVYCFRKNATEWQQTAHFWKDKSVSSILKTTEGQLWCATLQDGVFVIPAPEVLYFNKTNTPLLRNEAISHLTHDALGNFYFDTNDGNIYKYAATTNALTYFANTGEKRYPLSVKYDPYRQGVWVGAATTATLFSPTATVLQKHSIGQQKDWAFAKNGAIFNIDAGSLYVSATAPAIADTYFGTLPSSTYKTTDLLPNTRLIVAQRGSTVAFDEQKQRLFAGMTTGLLWLQNKKIGFLYDKKQAIMPTDIALTHDTMYVATSQKGLYIFKDTIIIAHLTTTNGLLSNNIKTVIPYQNGVWFATDKGIQNYNLAANVWQNITRADGLATYNVSDIAVAFGKIAVATNKGLQIFSLPMQLQNTVAPPIAITKVSVAERDTCLSANYTLSYHQNNINISFEGLAFRSRGEFKYRYRLVGLSSHWTVVDSKINFASYPSLPAGSYRFEVVALNEDGAVSTVPAAINFVITTPWWQRWWAYLLFFVGVVGIISAFFGVRLRLLRQRTDLALQKSDIEQQLRSSQLAALKVQMNPHFIFNALNSIQEYIVLNEKRLANAYLGKFADLMRYTLDMSQKTSVPLANEIKVLHLYLELESLRFEKDFEYTITIAENVEPLDIYIPPMLLQPYIENAIKHGLLHRSGHKKLSINIRLHDKNLHCSIEDDGIGRRRAQEIRQQREAQHTSFATSATQKRLELLNYGRKAAISVRYTDLYDAAQHAIGTRVELEIPIL
jgi:ligand-binding sensor domain-containing protein